MHNDNFDVEKRNKFLVLGFLEFAIIFTLMVAFFPWSLLFCVLFLGMEDTKLLVVALLHDIMPYCAELITDIMRFWPSSAMNWSDHSLPSTSRAGTIIPPLPSSFRP